MLMTPSSPPLASREPSGLHLSDWIVPWCAFRTRTHSPCCRSHQRSMPSLLPLSSCVPLGLQASACTTAFGSLKVYRHSPLRASQMKSSPLLLLPPPLASRMPSGLQATLAARPRCFCSFASSVPSEVRHRHTLPSSPQLARRVPTLAADATDPAATAEALDSRRVLD